MIFEKANRIFVMKEKTQTITPLSLADFQAMVYPKNAPVELPYLDSYFADLLKHFRQFAVGSYCWFVADRLKGLTHSAGGNTFEIFGIEPEALVGKGPELLFSRAHPDDLPKVFAFSEHWMRFLVEIDPEKRKNFLPCISLRLKNSREVYSWVMMQFLDNYIDNNGNLLFTFTAITDISHIRPIGETLLTIRDIENNTCISIRCHEKGQLAENSVDYRAITQREQEVLKLIASGLISKQVAEELGLSIYTVNNHRKSLLRKSGAKSTAELVSYGVIMGYLV